MKRPRERVRSKASAKPPQILLGVAMFRELYLNAYRTACASPTWKRSRLAAPAPSRGIGRVLGLAVTLAIACPCVTAEADSPAGRSGAPARQSGAFVDRQVEAATYTEHTADEAERPPGRNRGALRPEASEPLRLAPPGAGKSSRAPLPRGARAAGGVASLATGLASLAVVLGLFLVVAWALRRGMPASSTTLPAEVFQVLGRAPLAGRQQAHLVRCGAKLLLVSVGTAGVETLTEITEPVEVDRLAGLCRQAHPHSTTATFRNLLEQFGREKTVPGFVDADPPQAQGAATDAALAAEDL